MIELDGTGLTPEQVRAVARRGEPVSLSRGAAGRTRASWERLWDIVERGVPLYGLTTGFGALDGRRVPSADNRAQQRNLVMSHAAGVGPPMSAEAVRAMMLVRANVLASGVTGVQPETLDALIAMVNADVVPVVPAQGSVGACGDLAPLAHMALPLVGLGRARLGGVELPGAEAMRRAGIPLPDLRGRDGLALINGTEQTTGIGVLALLDAERLVVTAETGAAMSMEALLGLEDALGHDLALLKRHPGVVASADRVRALVQGSTRVRPPSQGHLRDALSLRCVPVVLGATRDALGFVREVITREINAANDNPIFFEQGGGITSNSGNFHGQAAGQALDLLATSVASVAVMSERRTARLVDERLNAGLPAFLVGGGAAAAGLHSGLMIAQYTAAALVAELRSSLVPASIQSIPTCANSEDHVSMSPIAARQAARTVETAETVVAIELLAAAQGVDLRGGPEGSALSGIHETIRASVPFMDADRVVAEDIEAVRRLIRQGALTGATAEGR